MHKCRLCNKASERTLKYYHTIYRLCRNCYPLAMNLKSIKYYRKYYPILDKINFASVWNNFAN